MPNVITHGILAQDVIQQLDSSSVTKSIQKYPQAYLFGSNGPDYLFYYYVVKPFNGYEMNEEIVELGNRVHREKINDFYEQGYERIKSLKGEEKKIFISYLAGHLTHWSLDTVAHPYVFHKTGLIEAENRYNHVRMESMIDTMMVKIVKRGKLKDYPSYKFVKLSSKEKLVIAKGYQFIVKELFGLDYKLKYYMTAINNMYTILHLFMDPTSLKKKSLQLVEDRVLENKWVFTKHFVFGVPDYNNDILNLQHNEWTHPTDESEVYTTSFLDLYNQAIERGVIALNKFEDDLKDDSLSLLDFIDNKKYDTGKNDDMPMVNFNVIY